MINVQNIPLTYSTLSNLGDKGIVSKVFKCCSDTEYFCNHSESYVVNRISAAGTIAYEVAEYTQNKCIIGGADIMTYHDITEIYDFIFYKNIRYCNNNYVVTQQGTVYTADEAQVALQEGVNILNYKDSIGTIGRTYSEDDYSYLREMHNTNSTDLPEDIVLPVLYLAESGISEDMLNMLIDVGYVLYPYNVNRANYYDYISRVCLCTTDTAEKLPVECGGRYYGSKM